MAAPKGKRVRTPGRVVKFVKPSLLPHESAAVIDFLTLALASHPDEEGAVYTSIALDEIRRAHNALMVGQ